MEITPHLTQSVSDELNVDVVLIYLNVRSKNSCLVSLKMLLVHEYILLRTSADFCRSIDKT